jgi:hypothetical protein
MKVSTVLLSSFAVQATAASSNSNGKLRLLGSKTGKSSKNNKHHPCAKRVADQIGWSNWYESVETFAPVFRVKSDKELRDIIKASKKEEDGETKCTVRPFGSTHTYDGMVMQRTETDVVP